MTEIDVKTAVTRAQAFVRELFPEKAADIRLEEVEMDENGRWWHVTLSFPGRDVTLFGAPFSTQREYKTVEVDTVTGEPRSVKIRVLNV